MNSASGNAVIACTTFKDARSVAASDASGDASRKRLMWLWSSTGASSRRDQVYRGHAAAMTRSAAATIAQRISSAPSSILAYRRRTASKPRLTSAVSRPSLPCSCTKRELMTGDSVTATMPDRTTAAARVIANSRNSEPVSPPWKAIGVYTVASVIVIAMIGPTSSRAPTSAASTRVLPRRTCRSTFSTTTIASSTTRPTDSTIARMVSRFRLKPAANITIAAPIRETGMATSGTSAVRTEPMNRNTTRATIRIVSPSVLVISFSASRMNVVPS